MENFKILRYGNKIVDFKTKNKKDDEITLTYKIINFIYPLSNKNLDYYNFKLKAYKLLNRENIPSYWCGTVYCDDHDLINKLYTYGKIHNGWNYKDQNNIRFSCNNFVLDTIVGDKFNVININATYKSPSWVIEELCRCIDEFMILNIQNGIQNI
jgi:hypothetical protein